jgi:Transposase DDE domain group 1
VIAIVPPEANRRKRTKARDRDRKLLRRRRRRLLDRIAHRPEPEREVPMITAANIDYQLGQRTHGLAAGGLGALLLLARRTGLIAAIDHDLHLLKRHLPYHESDHVLNIAFNLLAGGRHLEHLELRRNDEVYLDALGAVRIPDPTTAGDFCRRFHEADVLALMRAINKARLHVYAQQPTDFFGEAIVDIDGTLVGTDAECKEGVDIAYDGTWGYHPLVVTLANTAEPLFLVNRSGNRPSHEGAHTSIDEAIALCRRAGFRRVALRGDTDFSQTAHLDRWDSLDGVRFLFGMGINAALVAKAEGLPAGAYSFLERPPKDEIKTAPRQRPEHVKAEIVRRRGFETIHTLEEMVAEFDYRPTACRRVYRVVVLRKRLGIDKGSVRLREEYRYFFFITNDRAAAADELVLEANGRCDQENVIAQLKGGVHALKAPVNDLVSNWAYMVMASLAWTLKAWAALLLPEEPHRAEEHRAERRSWLRMEFATFREAVIAMPCQVVRGGGRLIYRLLSWNRWQGALLRLVDRLRVCWLY